METTRYSNDFKKKYVEELKQDNLKLSKKIKFCNKLEILSCISICLSYGGMVCSKNVIPSRIFGTLFCVSVYTLCYACFRHESHLSIYRDNELKIRTKT